MKLLFISDAKHLGGAEFSLYHILESLQGSHEIKVVIPPGDCAKKISGLGLPIKKMEMRVFRHSNPLPFLRTALRLKSAIKDFDPDWVVANGFNACEFSCLAAKLAGKRFCYFVRDFPEILDTWLRKLCFRQADLLVANSQAVKKEVVGFFGLKPDKIMVNYPPIDSKKFKPLAKSNPKLKKVVDELELKGKFVVGCFSRLSREKGQDVLIESVKALHDPKIKLLVVGDSKIGSKEFEDELKNSAKALGDNCIFTGFRKDLVELMNACDVIVCPSKKEPFGRVILEGLACGKPVIASKACGAKELVQNENTCLFIEPNTKAIEKNLKTIKKRLSRRMRKN